MGAPRPPRVTADGGAAPRPAPLAVGQLVGRYRVDEVLGAGGMGMVVRARDTDLDRDVALKVAVAASDGARDRRRAELLLREAQAMARLRARHVRAVHDVGLVAGIDYVAMEYIAGVDLARWLATPRAAADIVRAFAAAGRGLAAAHAAGILHRDFKPSNVLVGDDGEVVVTDFGIARWLHEAPEAGLAAGTPGYAAPEVALDARSDQYSFCVALDEALPAGARLRRRLDPVIRRGRAREPGARYASMEVVVGELEAAIRRPRWPIALAACAALAAAGAYAMAGDRAPHGTAELGAALAALPVEARLAAARDAADRGFLRIARRHAGAAADLAAARAPHRFAATQLALAEIELYAEDSAAARPLLESAARLADQVGDDRVRARALVGLFQLAVARGSDLRAAERAEGVAAAAVSRIAGDRLTRAMLRSMQGVLAEKQGRGAEARRAFAEARASLTPPAGGELVMWCEMTRALANRAEAAGDREAAVALDRELVATADRVAGRDHMTAISARGDLASLLELTGRYGEAAAVMDELRAAGRTEAGERLLTEVEATAPRPIRTLDVAVRDASGAPVAGATVVAATAFHSNARDLLGAGSLYNERARGTSIAVTDAHGRAALALGARPMWLAAEHPAAGRSPLALAPADDRAALALAPWGRLAGRASPGARIVVAPAGQPTAPRIHVLAATGAFAIERIPHGRYSVAACSERDGADVCRAQVAAVPGEPLDLVAPPGAASLVVRAMDELHRPIETSYVVLGPADFAPRDARELEAGWLAQLARATSTTGAFAAVHDTAPARFTGVPPGAYALCVAALHGDTEDPSFAARLEAHTGPLPVHCVPITLAEGTAERSVVVPASQRVWLGEPPR